jgi:hypothetical protein
MLVRSRDRPARSQSLYRLSYPAHQECTVLKGITKIRKAGINGTGIVQDSVQWQVAVSTAVLFLVCKSWEIDYSSVFSGKVCSTYTRMLPVTPTSKHSSNAKLTRTDWNFLQGRGEVKEMQQKETKTKLRETCQKVNYICEVWSSGSDEEGSCFLGIWCRVVWLLSFRTSSYLLSWKRQGPVPP